jgi:putative heme-binding domain-containing protein
MLAAARACADDDQRTSADRVDAIRLLALDRFERAGGLVAELISNRQPHEVQSAALATLSKYNDPSVGETVLAAWPGMSPRLKAEAAEALFARADRVRALLAAIERQEVSPADLDPARLKALAKHADAEIRRRAEPLVERLATGSRQAIVEAYRGALAASGDAGRGRQVFQKICASCHRLDGVGHEIGPNLASFRNRGAEAILVNVLDPNREVNPQYLNYVLVTGDGRSVTGMLAAETANSVTLRRADDASDTIERGQIDEMRSSGLSIMPEGLEKQIDQAAMADLLAYLMTAL